jgi:predicted outer membrane repeat protein
MHMERARPGALMRVTASGVTACILLGAGAGSARAALATSVPCKASALAAALGSATAGETLSLAAGCVYHLTQAPPGVSRDLTIDGNGAMIERSYASGTPAFTILTITGGAVTINDLEIRHGDNGITLSGVDATLTVNDSSFVSNHGSDGGAISNTSSANGPVITDSVFTDNKATGAGGAIYNNAFNGVMVTGSTFTGNAAAGDGGAIYDFCADGEHLTDSLVEGNKASDGGGIWFSPNSSMFLSQDTISYNHATGNGGGIAAVNFDETLQLQDSTITGNHAANGGGLYARQGGTEHITGSDFTDNTARNGGAIFDSIIPIDDTLSDTRIADNHAVADGGGLYYDSTTDPVGETWTATDTQITSNAAGSAGGGIFNTQNATGTLTNSQVHGNEPANCAPPGSVTGCTG